MRKSAAAPGVDVAGLQLEDADDVGEHFVVVARFDRRADEIHVAADAGKILPSSA